MNRANVELGLKIFAAAIALFGVVKYFADRADAVAAQKSNKALSYIESYGGGAMVETRGVLFEFWKRNSEYIGHVLAQGTTGRAYGMFARLALNEDTQAEALQGALFQMSNFYDQVWHCRKAGLCDAAMLDAYFCPRVTLQSAAYAPFLNRLGEVSGFDGFGQSLTDYEQLCAAG